jgi:NAD+ synthase (glutamine-hydrolysing)
VVVFPELCLSSYTARDLFFDRTMLAAVGAALRRLVAESTSLTPLALVGMPLETPHGIYNVAVAIQAGRARAAVPKSYLPSYREFEERRWFRPGTEVPRGAVVRLPDGSEVPFGTDIILEASADCAPFAVAVEICEDFWVQMPTASRAVGAGATLVANLSASNFTVGKAETRRTLARASSDRGKCAYLYVAAGPGESSTDVSFDSDMFMCENGAVVAEGRRFERGPQLLTTDVDLELLAHERRVANTFVDCAAHEGALATGAFRRIPIAAAWAPGVPMRKIARHPFVPSDAATLAIRTWETFEIQCNALATRMHAVSGGDGRGPKLVLGVSGGLDSTQAALVCAAALDMLGRPRKDLLCITMPGLGTTAQTKNNAVALAESLGAELRTISVGEASRVALVAMGHPAATGAMSVEELIKRV